jgi:hypothetical protein
MHYDHVGIRNVSEEVVVYLAQNETNASKQLLPCLCHVDAYGTAIGWMCSLVKQSGFDEFADLRRRMRSGDMQVVRDGTHRRITVALQVPHSEHN